MPKTMSLVNEPRPRGRAIRRLQVALLCLFAIAIAFPLYDISRICIATWQGMYGPVYHVETPVLDAIRECTRMANRDVHDFVVPYVSRLPWKPNVVLPLAFLWTGLAALLLRRN